MKLIVGLGNPGKEYDNTRHNIGFMYVDSYINNKFSSVDWKKKFNGLYYETINNGEKTIFVKPQSYMNLSGEVVSQFVNYYKIDLKQNLYIFLNIVPHYILVLLQRLNHSFKHFLTMKHKV